MAISSLAGPLSNLILSFVAVIIWVLTVSFLPVPYAIDASTPFSGKLLYFLALLLQYFHILNLYLAVFNLLPLPPLDGSKILYMFLPSKIYYKIQQYEQIIYFILLALLITGGLSGILSTACAYISNAMISLILLIPGL